MKSKDILEAELGRMSNSVYNLIVQQDDEIRRLATYRGLSDNGVMEAPDDLRLIARRMRELVIIYSGDDPDVLVPCTITIKVPLSKIKEALQPK